MSFTLHLSPFTRKQLYRRLQQAYAHGALRLVRRIHVLLALAEDMSVRDIAAMFEIGEQTKSIFSVVRERDAVFGHPIRSYDGKDGLN